nr:DUF2442 domain-containing protein [uncultured Halomonas sp.]
MIKLLSVEYQGNFSFLLEFSDGVQGAFNLTEYMANHKGPLLEPLKDEKYAKRCFIDAGALCWPNGLELSPARLHEPQNLKNVA